MRTVAKYLSLVIFSGLVLLGGCTEPQADSSTVGANSVLGEPEYDPDAGVEVMTLEWPPVSTFERACASCHGPGGRDFGEALTRLTDGQLTEAVRGMMESAGVTTASESDVQAMVAYQRAIAVDEPFICVTKFRPATESDPGILQGEATPGAEVLLLTCGHCWAEANENGFWEVNSPWDWAELAVQKDAKTTELSMLYAQWSHSVPLP